MNQFTQFAQQVQSLFVGMTPQARLLSVLLAAAIAVSAGILVSGSASGTQKTTYLFDGQTFNESQLSRFEVAFSTAGLRDWERVGSRIR
ncbi:MAG: beta-cystathionase, partial [Planctomycetes bacterium]|nr:beta-cystathionase [Planctomycetota bacterium]